MSALRPSQDGLEWTDSLFGPVPNWTRDVSSAAVESVCRQKLQIFPPDMCTVTFHASGIFNKLYRVQCSQRCFIMRVTLPVYPQHKTRAEVATLRWVRLHTTIPVPQVFCFDDSHDNEIGFEWILMEFMQGTPAHRRWRSMTMEQKNDLVQQIAVFQVELSAFSKEAGHAFRGIGTLELQDDEDLESSKGDAYQASPGRLVSHEFFLGDHVHYDIARGPFRSSHDWLSELLHIIILHQTAVLQGSDDGEKDDAETILPVARKLQSLLPRAFPLSVDEPETTGLYHDDLHLNNILVDEQGKITAILDWECVSAMPLWALTMVPKFLEEPVREEEPLRDLYADESSWEAAEQAQKRETDPDYLDNEGKTGLFFIHKMEYEATQLRKVYEAKLKELWPQWPLDESRVQVEFFKATCQCDGLWVEKAGRWADQMENGNFVKYEDA